MKVFFKPSFNKDYNKLPSEIQKEVYSICAETFPKLKSLQDFKNLSIKQMTGFQHYYRITIGDYRIGFKKVDSEQIEFMRVKHRKDIYKYFP